MPQRSATATQTKPPSVGEVSASYETPKLLLFAMEKKHFLGSLKTKTFKFHHYDMDSFSLYVNGKQIPSGGLT